MSVAYLAWAPDAVALFEYSVVPSDRQHPENRLAHRPPHAVQSPSVTRGRQ
jgi:hypothetical protein